MRIQAGGHLVKCGNRPHLDAVFFRNVGCLSWVQTGPVFARGQAALADLKVGLLPQAATLCLQWEQLLKPACFEIFISNFQWMGFLFIVLQSSSCFWRLSALFTWKTTIKWHKINITWDSMYDIRKKLPVLLRNLMILKYTFVRKRASALFLMKEGREGRAEWASHQPQKSWPASSCSRSSCLHPEHL